MSFDRAGLKATQEDLCNIPRLVSNYYLKKPIASDPTHQVAFGTSGHRGSANLHQFNEAHILAITQAIAVVRQNAGIEGPVFVGKDTHALSEPAFFSVIEVLIANGIAVITQKDNGYTPTPAISRAILNFNQLNNEKADGIVITPSHNPPQDGGIKYNPTHGGPAEGKITKEIEKLANYYLVTNLKEVKRLPIEKALASSLYQEIDLVLPYVIALEEVIDIKAIKTANLKLGVDPLGGAGIEYWKTIAKHYELDIDIINDAIDPSFRFMSLDKDGVIRMDCSSSFAMAGLLTNKENYDLAFGNDPDFDRHGIVTPKGLMNPNHYLAVCIDYLYRHRPKWGEDIAVGKTLVSSAIIDKVVNHLGRQLKEVPVGFKWFVEGLYSGQIGFSGEESAGATFLCFDGKPWTTDKDGIILCLLGAEIKAVTGKDPQEYYDELAEQFGHACYSRLQAPVSSIQKKQLSQMTPDKIKTNLLAGDPIIDKLTKATGNGQPIGGLKVVTEFGWFAARPSGTEDIYKIYCESFKGESHLALIEKEAQEIVNQVFKEVSL